MPRRRGGSTSATSRVPPCAAQCRSLPGRSRNDLIFLHLGPACGAEGRKFESCRARHFFPSSSRWVTPSRCRIFTTRSWLAVARPRSAVARCQLRDPIRCRRAGQVRLHIGAICSIGGSVGPSAGFAIPNPNPGGSNRRRSECGAERTRRRPPPCPRCAIARASWSMDSRLPVRRWGVGS